jgi:hypothetical protein
MLLRNARAAAFLSRVGGGRFAGHRVHEISAYRLPIEHDPEPVRVAAVCTDDVPDIRQTTDYEVARIRWVRRSQQPLRHLPGPAEWLARIAANSTRLGAAAGDEAENSVFTKGLKLRMASGRLRGKEIRPLSDSLR